MITAERNLPERPNLRDIPATLQSEKEISDFIAQCYGEEGISNKTMRIIMENAEKQLYLLRLRGAA